MSIHVASIVSRKRAGSVVRKSILMFLADRASDDGTGIWTSKASIAAAVECTRRTVISTIKDFVNEGILIECGQRQCANGYTVEYSIDLEAVAKLPDVTEAHTPAESAANFTSEEGSPVKQLHPTRETASPQDVKQLHPTRETASPKPSLNHPLTILEPSAREILADIVGDELAQDFLEHRRALKSKMTVQAAKLLAGRLRKMSAPREALMQSIENGWKSVYPTREPPQTATPAGFR